jgi:hypothetical protein
MYELEEIEKGFAAWVVEYERFVSVMFDFRPESDVLQDLLPA